MDGFSEFDYKGKTITYINYSNIGDFKEKILHLIQTTVDEYRKHPSNSILALTNITNIHFDMDILNAFKDSRSKVASYEKKIAIIGAKGLLLAACNCVIGAINNNSTIKIFDAEYEAKEWLVKD